mmetsp:Transcript_25929/g.72614  ORF Transcript_25929/g.72614 Transcript_25929/m.72614 type:complete len:242 (+) Transcript_25929:189-914(+)
MNRNVSTSISRLSNETDHVFGLSDSPSGSGGAIRAEYCGTSAGNYRTPAGSPYRSYYEVTPEDTPIYTPLDRFPDVEQLAHRFSLAGSGDKYDLCQSGSVCCGGGCGKGASKAPAAPPRFESSPTPPVRYSEYYSAQPKQDIWYPKVPDIYPKQSAVVNTASCACGKSSTAPQLGSYYSTTSYSSNNACNCSSSSYPCRVADVEAHLSQQKRNLLAMSAKMDDLERLTRSTISLARSLDGY